MIVLLAALFGVIAVGNASVENPPTAFFALLGETFPEWAVVAVTLLALLLVMSSVDTLFNALSSVVTADLPRLPNDPDDRTLSLGARALTIVVAITNHERGDDPGREKLKLWDGFYDALV